MGHPKTKGDRAALRKNAIKAMAKYMKHVMRMEVQEMEYRIIAKKAKHPKCDCHMCKRERSRDTRHIDKRTTKQHDYF